VIFSAKPVHNLWDKCEILYPLEFVAITQKTHYTPRDYPRLKARGCAVPKEKTVFRRFLMWQFIVTVCLTVIVGLLWGYHAARSTFFGGLLAVIPNIFLSIYLLWRANSIYVCEFLKIILTGILLVLLLHCVNVALAPLLMGLLGSYAVYFFSGFLVK